jgi:hypothetical protein
LFPTKHSLPSFHNKAHPLKWHLRPTAVFINEAVYHDLPRDAISH